MGNSPGSLAERMSAFIKSTVALFREAFRSAVFRAFFEMSTAVRLADGRLTARAIARQPDPVPKSIIRALVFLFSLMTISAS